MAPAVLYVDDETDNIVVFEAMYDRLFKVHSVSSAEDALTFLRTQDVEIGVILTDQRMPGMTGIDLAEMVHREFPDIVTLLITAYADLSAVIDAINRGEVLRYLNKPWEVGDVELALREGLSIYDMRRRISELERNLHESSRVSAMGVIAASLAHEISTPLTTLMLNLDLLSRATARIPWSPETTEVAAEMRTSLSDAIESARYLEDLVKGVRTATRPTTNDEVVDVSEVVGTVLRMVRASASKRARMSFDSLPVPPIKASRTKVGQMVLNLVVNAMQAFPERPAMENLVRVSLRHQANWVVLTVEDNGVGIDPDQLHKIWNPFFTTKRDAGTGLGLAITKHLVEEVGGAIAVEAPVGAGTRFRVTLPAME